MLLCQIFQHLFNLGTEFKTVACPITGVLRFMEIQRG